MRAVETIGISQDLQTNCTLKGREKSDDPMMEVGNGVMQIGPFLEC